MRKSVRLRRLCFGVAAAGLIAWLPGGLARADIISVSGSGDILTPTVTPPGLVKSDFNTGYTPNFFQDTGSSILVHGWDEVKNFTLTSAITVDAVSPGTYDSNGDLGTFSIAAGTVVNSHYLYFDPKDPATRTATFTFDGKILGVIAESDLNSPDRFLASDSLRNVNSWYPLPFTHFTNRGLEMGSDEFVISADMKSVTVKLSASNPGDQMRIVTQAVPEPSSMVLVATGGLMGLAAWRKKSRRRLTLGS